MEVSQGRLGGGERSQSGLGLNFRMPCPRLSTALLTREGSELKHKLIPLTVRSVLAEMSQRRWLCQKYPPP